MGGKTKPDECGVQVLAKGVEVSNDTKKTGLNNNLLVVGSSGMGKTGGVVIPNLQKISGSMIVSDTKKNLYRSFKDELEGKGYKVVLLDFTDPLNSYGYNPFDGITKYGNGMFKEQDVMLLANILIPQEDPSEPFWSDAARGYVSFLLAYCMSALPENQWNMASVCELHRVFISPIGRASMLGWVNKNPKTFAAKKFRNLGGLIEADRTWGCVQEFANRGLEPFEFSEYENIFSNNPNGFFDIGQLGREKTALFINVSDTDTAFDKFVTLFYAQTLQVLCRQADANEDSRLKVPTKIYMDDFAASAKIPDFDRIISVIRSRDISVSIFLQSLTQLKTMYGEYASTTIIDNCSHLLYLGGQNSETAKYIAMRANVTPETVLYMPKDKAYLLEMGKKAELVTKIVPYSTVENYKNA